MEKENLITLSFVDNSIAISTVGEKTYATIKSGFKFTKFDAYFRQFGFKNLPEFVVDILDEYGYRADFKTGMWVTKTTANAECSPEDEYNETTGKRIALMRAKAKSYQRASFCITAIWKKFHSICTLMGNSENVLEGYLLDEVEAIGRVIRTGKSDFINE